MKKKDVLIVGEGRETSALASLLSHNVKRGILRAEDVKTGISLVRDRRPG